MYDDPFEPAPVPLNSRALVNTLKRRLLEAIETGKASDAKIFLDVIERLAKMDWLDDRTPQERFRQDRAERERAFIEVDKKLAAVVKKQNEGL
jgi:SOS response regulatory protein OraA/RecX